MLIGVGSLKLRYNLCIRDTILKLYRDHPRKRWPAGDEENITMFTRAPDIEDLLTEANI